jgi:hypothetical protein
MLYHCTTPANLPCIKHEMALYSAAKIAPDRTRIARDRDTLVIFGSHAVTLRDQCALRRGQMHLDRWSWEDLLAALNGRVFFWPQEPDRRSRYAGKFVEAYRKKGQSVVILRIPVFALMEANPGNDLYFCKYNSGGPRISAGKKSPRGPDTFRLLHDWHDRPSDVAEVSFVGKVVLPPSTEVSHGSRGWQLLTA